MKPVIARFKKGGEHFEILVYPKEAAEFRKGIGELSNVLVSDEIYLNSKDGKKASDSDLKKAFKTDKKDEIAKIILKEGDIISVDCGVIMNGWYGDSAFTFPVGIIRDDVKKLLDYTRASLEEGVRGAVSGNRVGDISFAVQNKAESGGFSVVRELVGHGLGKKLHEQPEVPNYGKKGTGPKMEKGLVICIEPMINAGKKETYQMGDGWTIKTADGKLSAHFEYAVAVGKGEPDVLTTFKFIDEVLNKM